MTDDNYRNPAQLNSRIEFYQKFGKKRKGWYQWISDQIDLSDGDVVLEIGCGSGTLWDQGTWNLMDGRVLLSDQQPEMVKSARDSISKSHIQFEYLTADALDLPFSDEQFEVVIANHVLHLVNDLDRAIKEIHRVLKPGGILYTSTKSSKNFEMIDNILEYIGKDTQMNDIVQFELETADETLSNYFDHVQQEVYIEQIQVDDPDALMWFIESKVSFSPEMREKVRTFLNSRINNPRKKDVGPITSPIEFQKRMGLIRSIKQDSQGLSG